MEAYLRTKGFYISRQTIAKYRMRLTLLEYYCNTSDFIYYKVYRDWDDIERHEPIEADEYKRAWRLYWDKRNNENFDSEAAFAYMYAVFGGVPRKQARQHKNAIKKKELNYLMDLVSQSIYKEVSVRE